MCMMGPLALAIAQNATRREQHIQGNWFCDIWESVFCFSCASCRQAREVDLKNTPKEK